MHKKVTLKHMQENGHVATRTTARPYTHVLLSKLDKAVATDAEKARLEPDLKEAEARARTSHDENVADIAAGVGGQIRYKPGQGGYKKLSNGSYATYTQTQWHYDYAVECHARYGGTLEGYIAAFTAETQKRHERRLSEIENSREHFAVVSWHSRADLAKPDHPQPGSLYKVEAINGGNRTDMQQLLAWADEEYRRRTKAIESGESTNIDWLEPATRLCISEIMAEARRRGMSIDRLELQQSVAAMHGRKYT